MEIVYVCMCVSVTSQYCIKMAALFSLFWLAGFLDLSYTVQIRLSLKITMPSSETLSQTLALENLATA